jgi:hypothetical protein
MNPLVKKEIRLLLPGVATCCALGLANFFFRFGPNGSLENGWCFALAFVFCGGVAVMLTLNSFGAEVSSGTFSNLLAQPISRQKIWDTKILLLALSLLFVGAFWSGCGLVRLTMVRHDFNLLDLFTGVGIFELVIFSGGLWTVLLFRQIAAAFWLTVLVPGCILVVLAGLFADHSSEFIEGVMASVLGIYSLAGFFFARWLFFRAQDSQWTGGTLVLPEMRGSARLKSLAGVLQLQTPSAALWRKEFQLHQSQFVVAFMLLVLHLGVIATRHLGHFRKNSTTEFILESFWALWLVMPVLVGCAAVAEERRLGMHESQLCLPVRRRTQFRIKLLVALGLSSLFGVVMPLLLEGSKILPDTGNIKFFFGPSWWNLNSPAMLSLAGLALLIGGVSFYASTLARNALQTLAPAVAGVVITWFLFMVATIPMRSDYWFDFLWHGPLPYFIVFPAMAVTLLALAFRNYQHVLTGWTLGRRNLLMLATVFALSVIATSATYHRFWEKFTSFEPPHGAARLTPANPAQLSTDGGVSVRLADGSIWMAMFSTDLVKMTPAASILGNFKMALADRQFISGTNWLTVKRAVSYLVGIKTDGTLWISEKPRQVTRQNGRLTVNEDEMRHLMQIGTENSWNSLLPWEGGYSVWLTKTDGTLWRWNLIDFENRSRTNRQTVLHSFTPERLGTETNWAEVFQGNYRICLRKTDGNIWSPITPWETNSMPHSEIEPGFFIGELAADLTHGQYRSIETINGTSRIGIRDDGTFRIYAHQLLTTNTLTTNKNRRYAYPAWKWFATDMQIGTGTNWLDVTGYGEQIVTLKSDGTLWLWKFPRDNQWASHKKQFEAEIQNTVPVRLGTHSDWVAISSSGNLVITLAADGSLWFWPIGNEFYWTVGDLHFGYGTGTGNTLLDISRKPQFLGNVFDKAD